MQEYSGLRLSRRSILAVPAVAACAVVVGQAMPARADDKRKADAAWSDADAAVAVTSRDPMNGERLAPVTMVVFGEYQCPFCGKLEETIGKLTARYGAKTLRVVFKQFPLDMHARAKPASLAAEAVFERGGNKAFWLFHQRAFANQKDLTDDNFVKWAKEAGMEEKAFKTAAASKPVAERVAALMQQGKDLGVTGTPTSFVNGVLVSGSRDEADFAKIIDAEITATQALVGKVKADRVYVERCNANMAAALAAKKSKP
ncbi:MAG: thioredoxin domain-containing protein [Polyangiaceae bacterium]